MTDSARRRISDRNDEAVLRTGRELAVVTSEHGSGAE